MSDTRDISGHFRAVGEADPGDLSDSGVRLLGRGGGDFDANAALERSRVENRPVFKHIKTAGQSDRL